MVGKTAHYTHYHRGSNLDIKTETKGGLALMGGSTDVDDVFTWMADQGGNGDFLVLRGSGSDGYQAYIDEIADVNSVSTVVIHDRQAAEDPFVLDKVKKAEAVFFAGGDQWNYVGKWKDTPLLNELNEALERGVPMGGTSAGLAILGEHVYTAQNASITSAEALEDPYDPGLTVESDFLKAPHLENVVTDSHFSERDRMGRLVTFLSRVQADRGLETTRGIGVDERTAVLLWPDGIGETRGEGKAHYVKAFQKPTHIEPGQPLSHDALELHSVGHGQSFDFRQWSSHEVELEKMMVLEGRLRRDR